MRLIPLALTAVLLTTACAGTSPLSSTLNKADRDRMEAAHFYAFNGTLSQQSVWSNVATGLGGTVRSLEEHPDPETGLPCRKFVETLRSTNGQNEDRTGTACQQPDGNLIVTFDPSRE